MVFQKMSVTLIDKNDISDHTKRETFWIHALKTASYEINIYLKQCGTIWRKELFSLLGIF